MRSMNLTGYLEGRNFHCLECSKYRLSFDGPPALRQSRHAPVHVSKFRDKLLICLAISSFFSSFWLPPSKAKRTLGCQYAVLLHALCHLPTLVMTTANGTCSNIDL
ncbi:unnamed protein product [Protopolystoma xenopodis]|uniref:Uncharacterized protein n=1 Tax=Protopolystoma xenopodis TaxID=117903 RepID=A0A3S5CH13_9PLAT|nr:unnamed protein product [Protopolystoma xenopodis]